MQGAGTLLLLLGLTVMAGWLLRLPGVLQILSGQVAMVFSTALCFALAGVALLIPGRWPTRAYASAGKPCWAASWFWPPARCWPNTSPTPTSA